eukprot:958170-Rhodomonas_salina.1
MQHSTHATQSDRQRQRDGEAGRQKDRETERQRDRETERQRDRALNAPLQSQTPQPAAPPDALRQYRALRSERVADSAMLSTGQLLANA